MKHPITLVEGDDVTYDGSLREFVGRRFVVTGRAPVAALHLAALAEGEDVHQFPEAYRYEVTNVSAGAVLTNVRRSSLVYREG